MCTKEESLKLEWEDPKEASEEARVETVLQRMTGWSGLLVPFLAQNIGWFISAFLFIAGTLFVIVNTDGFAKAFIISASLLTYTLLMIFGAYQIKRRRPDIRITSEVLMTLAMLMIPLSLLASYRMVAIGSFPSLYAAIPMSLAGLFLLFKGSEVATGTIERSLAHKHSRLFMVLAALQFGGLLLQNIPSWPLLALLHIAILTAFAWSVRKLGGESLQSIFLDNKKAAVYSVGTLLFAALVSFVSLSMSFKGHLPGGYYGPFLMLFTGVIFYADASFKEITKRYTFLSQLNFFLYGLSIASMAVSLGGASAKVITLAIGALVYGLVVQRYLTLTPFYLLITCLGWLYGLVVLKHVNAPAHFLASIPALAGFYFLHGWALKHKAVKFALICFRSFFLISIALISWSLIQSTPGITATLTMIAITASIYFILRFASLSFFHGLGIKPVYALNTLSEGKDLRDTPLFYIVTLSAVITLAFFPVEAGLDGAIQFAFSLLILAGFWTEQGIKNRSCDRSFIFLNSAFVTIIAAPIFAFASVQYIHSLSLHIVMLLSAILVARQSLSLGSRPMLYIAITLGGAGVTLFRHAYIPWPSSGTMEMAAALIVWIVSWRIVRSNADEEVSMVPKIDLIEAPTIIGLFKTSNDSVSKTLRVPLMQLTAILWGFSLILQFRFFLEVGITTASIATLILSTVTTMLLCIYYRRIKAWPLPLSMALVAFLAFLHYLGVTGAASYSLAAVCFAIVVWIDSVGTFGKRLVPHLSRSLKVRGVSKDDITLLEVTSLYTSSVITAGAIAYALFSWLASPSLSLAPPLLAGVIFFGITGRYYIKEVCSYIVLALTVVTVMILHCHIFSITAISDIFIQKETDLVLLLTGLIFTIAASIIYTLSLGKETMGFSEKLYLKPFHKVATALVGMGSLLLFLHSIGGETVSFLFIFESVAVASFIQLYKMNRCRFNAQMVLASLFMTAAALLLELSSPLSHLPLMLALWSALLLAWKLFTDWRVKSKKASSTMGPVLSEWLSIIIWPSFIGLLILPVASLRESIVVLLLQTAVIATLGWRRNSENHISIARILAIGLLLIWPILFLPPGDTKGMVLIHDLWPILSAQFERLKVVFSWYAFQLAMTSLVLTKVAVSFSHKFKGEENCLKGFSSFPVVEYSLALIFWLLNFMAVSDDISRLASSSLFINASAALASAGILIYITARRACKNNSAGQHLFTLILSAFACLYLRLIILGPVPVNLLDSIVLMAAAYGAFYLKGIMPGKKGARVYNGLELFLPLSALLTLAGQQTSLSTVASLFLAAGALYLTDYYYSQRRPALYGGVLSINIALYLWIPVWMAGTNLFQLYTVPASMSVLILAQLHRNELKKSVISNVRLAALCTLYASASLDLFLRPELWVFGLFLALSLGGVAAGIALRIRAFLYSSVAFLIMNVMGQLMRFYPDEGIGKGILLMLLGTIIMGGMVWFNIKRESILKRVRIYRADIADWE